MMWKNIVFGMLVAWLLAGLVSLLVMGILAVVRALQQRQSRLPFRRIATMTLAALMLTVGFAWYTQVSAFTPAIIDDQGRSIPGSVAKMQQVELNGRKEWITLRGHSDKAPILLFLAGGPGGSQTAAVRRYLGELEKHFLVVNWDQPGSAKSYYVVPTTGLTPDIYLQDGIALAKWLMMTYGQEKIWLMGESWGSALGVMMVHQAPELFHGFFGTGQMVAFLETELIDYRKALDIATQAGDQAIVDKLRRNGPPPYPAGGALTWKSFDYLQYLGGVMARDPRILGGGNNVQDMLSEEYGMLDKLNYVRGLIVHFGHVYHQLYEIDLRERCPKLQVPIYFLLGRHDINAPVELAQDYFDKLIAPHKEIRWFEHSGHNPWITEPGRFVAEVLDITGVK